MQERLSPEEQTGNQAGEKTPTAHTAPDEGAGPLSIFQYDRVPGSLFARKGEAAPAIDRRGGARTPEEVVAEHRAILALKKKQTEKQRAEIREATASRPGVRRDIGTPLVNPKRRSMEASLQDDHRPAPIAAPTDVARSPASAPSAPSDARRFDASTTSSSAEEQVDASVPRGARPRTITYEEAVSEAAFEKAGGLLAPFDDTPSSPKELRSLGVTSDDALDEPSALAAEASSIGGGDDASPPDPREESQDEDAPILTDPAGRNWLAARRRQTIRLMSGRFQAMLQDGDPPLAGPGARAAAASMGDPEKRALAERKVRARLYLSLRDYMRLTLAASVLGLEEEDLAITALNAYFDACGVERFDDCRCLDPKHDS